MEVWVKMRKNESNSNFLLNFTKYREVGFSFLRFSSLVLFLIFKKCMRTIEILSLIILG